MKSASETIASVAPVRGFCGADDMGAIPPGETLSDC